MHNSTASGKDSNIRQMKYLDPILYVAFRSQLYFFPVVNVHIEWLLLLRVTSPEPSYASLEVFRALTRAILMLSSDVSSACYLFSCLEVQGAQTQLHQRYT